ncbi:hypothetical protein PCANC_25864 [Puccinia coronata f. sp. avenae]|uniref:Uncharacterized protein n=1 Tax=Puccinia coronata f. sp. avenae TaxID=200324 RepID=A0A2N5TJ57_9BASI|nr:hypothetical protein PCANC_25623 [Puccinia coronata f. sp. avenae]PLW26607.1 hypothetical protein PCANC_25864 [Puccinia coronata f. sp. avenae]
MTVLRLHKEPVSGVSIHFNHALSSFPSIHTPLDVQRQSRIPQPIFLSASSSLRAFPPVISNDYVNNLEPGCANAPIEIYDGNSDEAASTDCIDPSLRRDSPDLGAGIPTPGLSNHATSPVVQTAPPIQKGRPVPPQGISTSLP